MKSVAVDHTDMTSAKDSTRWLWQKLCQRAATNTKVLRNFQAIFQAKIMA